MSTMTIWMGILRTYKWRLPSVTIVLERGSAVVMRTFVTMTPAVIPPEGGL